MFWLPNLLWINQLHVDFITKWGASSISFKVEKVLLQRGAAYDITTRNVVLQSRGSITNWGNFYYKVKQVLRNGTIITKWRKQMKKTRKGNGFGILIPWFIPDLPDYRQFVPSSSWEIELLLKSKERRILMLATGVSGWHVSLTNNYLEVFFS